MYGDASPTESLERIQEQTGGQIDDGAVGTFSRVKEYHEVFSAQKGEPVHVFTTYCKIRTPGNRGEDYMNRVQVELPDGQIVVSDDYNIKRFGKAWDAFQRGEDLRPEGTAIEDCADIPRERIAGLKTAGIRTVEELATLPDRSLQRVGMDARALQRIADDYLKTNNETSKMRDELADLRSQLEALKNGNSKGDTPKRRGRPRRDSADVVRSEQSGDSAETTSSG